MDRIRRDTLLGLVFFGTLGFLLWATVNLTDIAVDGARLKVWFDQAGSCAVGTNVMVLGKKIGKVHAIDIDFERDKRPVLMELLLRERIPLREKYSIVVRGEGVLGAKIIYIDPGLPGGPLLPDSTEWIGEVEPNAFEQIGNIANGQGPVGENLNGTLANLRELTSRMVMKEGGGTIAKLVNDSELHDRLVESVRQLQEIFTAVNEGKGAIGQLIVNAETGDNARNLVANLRSISDRLLTTDGMLGVLLNDKETAMNVQTLVANLQTMVANSSQGKGMLGRIVADEALAQQFASLVANLDTLMARAVDPSAGIVGALTSDPQGAENLRMTIANLREVTDKLTRNEGLIGALINDKDMAVRFRRILTQVSRAIEDAREAAPIANFVQVLLGTL
jgi:ABC-type transporter Mla subunit MlaD